MILLSEQIAKAILSLPVCDTSGRYMNPGRVRLCCIMSPKHANEEDG